MIMGALAGLVSFFGGGWAFKVITIPLLIVMALVGFHVCLESWKNNLKAAGAAQCDARWEQKIRAEERSALSGQLDAAHKLLTDERQTTEALNADNDQLREKYNRIVLSADPKCLSPGVLNELGGSGVEQPDAVAKARRPQHRQARPAKPTAWFDFLLPNEAPKKGGSKPAAPVSGSAGD